jgi:hypothetical protein
MLGMDEKDALASLGLPDEVVDRSERMRSCVWVCSTCREVVTSPTPIPVPAPCPRCGGIAFETTRPASRALAFTTSHQDRLPPPDA